VTGNLTGNVTGNVTGDVTGDLTGTVLTAAQPNITSVGTLTGLDVTGTPTFDGLTVDGNILQELQLFLQDLEHLIQS